MAFSTPSRQIVKFLSAAKKAFGSAKFMVMRRCSLLDEPTNHLDIPSKEMLGAIRRFEGTVIAISHDRYFLRQIATSVLG